MEGPRKRIPEERPGQILEAALVVFGERGLASARVEEVAERAGISKGTIYLYFPSKEDLFRAVIRSTWSGMLESIESVEPSGDARADLMAVCGSFWSFLRSPSFATAHRLVVSEIHSFPDMACKFAECVRQPILRHIGALLDRGVTQNVFTPGDGLVRARLLFSMLLQHAIWCARRAQLRDLDSYSDDEVLRQVLDFFLDATAFR